MVIIRSGYRVCVRFETLFGRSLNDFAPLVLAAFRADPVRNLGLVAVRAFGESRLAQGVVSAAALRALIGVASFRIRHCSYFP